MNSIQYPLNIDAEAVQALHAFYVQHTNRQIRMDHRIERGWIILLTAESLAGAPITIDDVKLVIRYLHKRVTDPGKLGPRHPGCLKLNQANFFNLDRFKEDLAEAKAIMGRRKQTTPPRPTHTTPLQFVERPAEPVDPEAHKRFMDELADRKQRRAQTA